MQLNARLGMVLVICSIASLWAIMALLGLFFVDRQRRSALESEAVAGSLYIEGFLAPHARKFLESMSLPAESRAELMTVLGRPTVEDKIAAFKLWDLDGTLVFRSDGAIENEDHIPDDLAKAIAGEVVAEIYPEGAIDENTLVGLPLIEVHAPIHDAAHTRIVAVGEIYVNAETFLKNRLDTERSIWVAIGAAAFGLTGLMLLLAAQRAELARRLQATRTIAAQNQALRENADLARLSASQSNEDLLNRLGAELHDGPIQMLTLITLLQGEHDKLSPPGGGLSVRELTDHTMADLRAISAGLILPEIAELSLEEALRLAVTRHEQITGRPVNLTLSELPATVDPALKICCYRLVQEGLANASKHGNISAPEVFVSVADGCLALNIRNGGRTDRAAVPRTGRTGGLGLQGLRARLAVFGGVLQLVVRPEGGADLIASIPLLPNSTAIPLPDTTGLADGRIS